MFRNRFAGQLAGKLAALAQLRELQSDDDEQEP